MCLNLKLSIHKPSDNLKNIVKHYVVIESLEEDEKLWVLPNAGNFLLFNPGLDAFLQKYNSNEVSFTLPPSFSVGIKANDIIRLNVVAHEKIIYPLIGVELLPTGYHRLFNENAFDLRTEHRPLEKCLEGKDVSFENLYNLDSLGHQISYIEEGLLALKKLASPIQNVFKTIEEIIQYIFKTITNVKVNDILEKFSYSRTSLERDFKKIVGYTPKEFIQIMRFCMIFKDLILNGYDYRKLEYDFFDQSHMNKALKKFIDIPPSKLQAYILENNIQVYQANE